MRLRCLPFMAMVACLAGCTTYRYRVVQPNTGAPPVSDQPVALHYEPLDYRLVRERDRLALHIQNPTDDRIVMQGNRSFAVDPTGESHPLRDRVIAPHSYSRMLVPPLPFTYAYPDYWWGPPGGWGWYGPWGPWYGPWYGPYWGPSVSYATVPTTYDWQWKTGPARLRLTYERAGKVFEHDFEVIREAE